MESEGSSNKAIKYTSELPNSSDINDSSKLQNEAIPQQQQQYISVASVIRIMRGVLPAHAKIADDAKESIQECISEFISIITGEANKRCYGEYRKTITPEDVISVMRVMGFDNFVQPLTAYLTKHRHRDQPQPQPPHGGSAHLPFLINNRVQVPHFVQQPTLQMELQMPPRIMGVYLTTPGSYGYDQMVVNNQYYQTGIGSSFNGVEFGQWYNY